MANLPDMRKLLQKMLSPEQLTLLRTVSGRAEKLDLPLYLVGGVVRDLILELPASDIDLVVVGDAIPLANAIAKKYGGRVTVHTRFKTARWFLPESFSDSITGFRTLDFTSARTETYKYPSALPTVHFGSLSDDLQRRDFTLNALALRLDGNHFGELHDDTGGLNDLHNGLLRVLHPLSFIDDPTRLFRLIRYEGRYGFRSASGTQALIPEALPGIKLLSAERVRHELDQVLKEENTPAILRGMAKLGILAAVHPVLDWNDTTRARFENAQISTPGLHHHPSPLLLGWSLWLMDVTKTELGGINKRLHFDARTRDALSAASDLFTSCRHLIGKKPSQIVAQLDAIPLVAVSAVLMAQPLGPVRQ